ncbi:MAG: hypothetical protein AB1898_26390 [Acidobacteriota bacterium]
MPNWIHVYKRHRDQSLMLSVPLLLLFAITGFAERGDQERPRNAHAQKEEWTFERAREQWTPMLRPVAHVGVPGYQFQAAVLWDGSLVFGPLGFENHGAMQRELTGLGPHRLHLSIGYGSPLRFPDRASLGNPELRRNLEEGQLPIPQVSMQDGDLAWQQVVFAHLLGRTLEEGMQPREDDVLAVHVQFRVLNTALQPRNGYLWLHFGDTSQVRFGYKAGVNHLQAGNSLNHRFEAPLGLLDGKVRYLINEPSRGTLVWHDELAPPRGMMAGLKNVIEWRVTVASGEEATLHLVLPFGLVDQATGTALQKLNFDREREGVRRYWRQLLDREGTITTPDRFINDYLAAVPSHMSQQVAYRHKAQVWMYKTSPNHYEQYWPCNAAKALPTFDLRGLAHISRPVLKSFIDTQSEDVGLLGVKFGTEEVVQSEGWARIPGFLGNFGPWTANTLLLSHGLEMWSLASHYRITRDREWLADGPGSPLQALIDAFDWTAKQRRRTMREEDGRKVPHWGLLPAASSHDWLAGNTISNDAFVIFGMIETVRLLREIGHPRTEELARELNDYRATLRQRYEEARDRSRPLPMADGSLLPFVPRDVYELDWTRPDWTYTGYGPLRAGAWGAFDPHDQLVDQALAYVEAGMPKGQGQYINVARNAFGQPTGDENFRDISDASAPRHYMWRHYVEYETMWPIGVDLFLQRDDLPRFFEWFFNNMAFVVHRDFRVGVESVDGVPSNAPGDGERWRAVRNMFINEFGGYDGSQQGLWLLQAIPRSWLKPSAVLSAKDMRTHFGGRVNLDIKVAPDGNSVQVAANLKLAVAPAETRMRLRSGDGRALASATVNGKKVQVSKGDVIELPASTSGDYRVTGYFR